MSVTVSVIIPAYNSGSLLTRCLQSLRDGYVQPCEVIVVDDGSQDETTSVAASFGATVFNTGGRKGPSFARNIGARAAQGEVLFFLDSDVCVHPRTLLQVAQSFEEDPALDAVVGSYDRHPASQDFLSQYRNLMHAYVHQTGAKQASTFWSGCGAIRRSVFLEQSGFSESYRRPAIEDIELGYRLISAGRKIVLNREIEVMHLKRWTFWGIVKTDILDRGIPWTELILRDQRMPNDLNLQLSQRVSVALVFVLVALCGTLAVLSGALVLLPLITILCLVLVRWWSESENHQRPRIAFGSLAAVLAAICAAAYHYKMYGLIPPLLTTPVLLLLRHRYQLTQRLRGFYRWIGVAYICCAVAVAAHYLPAHHLIFAAFAVLALLGLLNSQFYIFLAGNRGVGFMLAAIPFHLLYHFYNGLSFAAGVVRHLWATANAPGRRSQFNSDSGKIS